jgi:hypothetical protein
MQIKTRTQSKPSVDGSTSSTHTKQSQHTYTHKKNPTKMIKQKFPIGFIPENWISKEQIQLQDLLDGCFETIDIDFIEQTMAKLNSRLIQYKETTHARNSNNRKKHV